MKNYLVRFGQTDPANYTGLTPTFTIFASLPGGVAQTAPGFTESPSGSGLYSFGYSASTFGVAFKIDGGATLSVTDRYVCGLLDPIQAVDQQLSVLQGVVGGTADSFGSTLLDPSTVFGYLKRNQEVSEGTASYQSASGSWVVASRALVSGVTVTPVVLFSHVLTNNSGSVIKG